MLTNVEFLRIKPHKSDKHLPSTGTGKPVTCLRVTRPSGLCSCQNPDQGLGRVMMTMMMNPKQMNYRRMR